ncbi:MAG: DNA alkylation repair protein [Candidatus Paceibacterota bacterium]|jgi:3-methyladenine DNA glycosylase AlkD
MNQDKLKEIHGHILKIASMQRAELALRFFKTGKGEYGEGDKFLGLTVPQTRKLVRVYGDINLKDTEKLLKSEFHDERLLALLIMVNKFEKAKDEKIRREIFEIYLKNIKKYINNWDLVDTSAPKIVGAYLSDTKNKKERKEILQKLSDSKNLWENRVSIIATLYFIMKEKNFKDTLEMVDKLLHHEHDLIHKANGWMLREVYKRVDQEIIRKFLKKNYHKIPRTTLRYAIEKMEEAERKNWIKGNI